MGRLTVSAGGWLPVLQTVFLLVLFHLGCERRSRPTTETETKLLCREEEIIMSAGSDAGAARDAGLQGSDNMGTTDWRWPQKPGRAIGHHARPGPHYREYFPPVWLQIIDLPDSSDRLLSQALRGLRPTNPPDTEAAVREAGAALGVRSEYFGFQSSGRFAFPMEGGCCDLVRSRWKPRKGSYVIDGTRARHVQSLRVRNWERDPSRSVVDQVNEFAAEFFDRSPQGVLQLEIEYRFIQINDADGTKAEDPAYGCHDTDWRTYGKHAPHYADYMHWWVRPGEIGFISSTHDGIVHQGFTPIDGERNVHWFGAASQPQQKGPPPDPSLAPALRAARRSGARVR